MSDSALLDIDPWRLRFFLFGLEARLGVSFPASVVERIFSEADRVNEKRYVLFESARLLVVGTVEEYEPETIELSVEGGPRGIDLSALWDSALYHSIRARDALSEESDHEA